MVRVWFQWATKDGLHSAQTNLYIGPEGVNASQAFNDALNIGTDMQKSGAFGVVGWHYDIIPGSK